MDECLNCKKPSPEGSRFCPFCGQKLAMSDRMICDPFINKAIAHKYLVRKKLGSGAMGSIYLATHTGLDKDVCLKILHKHLLHEEGHFQRFRREARAASRLDHPNIISILDFGVTEDETTYIAMEYVDGIDLARKLYKEGAYDLKRATHVTVQICDALEEAHSKNVIHRDLKPENIMIGSKRGDNDFVKVLDFGIAKIRDASCVNPATFQTATGMIFGTPEYMSPEQIRGEELDGRSDLYSLGILLFQMLSNKLPFAGNTILEIATKHLSYPPPSITSLVPDIPEKMDKILMKLLAKKRENRFSTASEVKKSLEPVSVIDAKTVLLSPAELSEISGSTKIKKEVKEPKPDDTIADREILQEKDTEKVLMMKKVAEEKRTKGKEQEKDQEEKRLFSSRSTFVYIILMAIALGIFLSIIIFITSE